MLGQTHDERGGTKSSSRQRFPARGPRVSLHVRYSPKILPCIPASYGSYALCYALLPLPCHAPFPARIVRRPFFSIQQREHHHVLHVRNAGHNCAGRAERFELFGWSEHLGNDDSSGHYVAITRHTDGSFRRCGPHVDSRMHAIFAAQKLRALGRDMRLGGWHVTIHHRVSHRETASILHAQRDMRNETCEKISENRLVRPLRQV